MGSRGWGGQGVVGSRGRVVGPREWWGQRGEVVRDGRGQRVGW